MTEATKPEWQLKAEQAKQEREEMKRVVAALAERNVHFIELHGYGPTGKPETHMTIAFKEDRRNVVFVATSITHPNDKFDKLKGRFYAGVRLAQNAMVVMRRPANSCYASNKEWLKSVFEQAV